MQKEEVTTSSPPRGRALLKPLMKKGHRDLIAAIASGFVGALALATSTYNVYLQRQQVRAQVWPRLEYAVGLHRDEGFWIKVTNNGVGSAQIERVRVNVDGAAVGDWPEAAATLLRTPQFSFESVARLEDRVLSPGQTIIAFTAAAEPFGKQLLAERRRLVVELCYCSSLGECWSLNARGIAPPKTETVDDCRPDPKPFATLSEEFLDRLARHGFSDAGSPDAAAPTPGDR